MANSQFTPDELLRIVGHTYASVDVRVAATKEENIWQNYFTIIRFSHLPPRAASKNLRETAGGSTHLVTANFRIETIIQPIANLKKIRAAIKKGVITINKLTVHLNSVDWSKLPAGYLGGNGIAKPTTEGHWPAVESVRACSQPRNLYDTKYREVSATRFANPYDAIADICGANVWPSTSHSGDFYVRLPVFATLDETVLSSDRHQLNIRVRKHARLKHVQVIATQTRNDLQGPAQRSATPVLASRNATAVDVIHTDLMLKAPQRTDRVELRLVHAKLGEVGVWTRLAEELVPPEARPNVLFTALQCFCSPSNFKELLVHPWAGQKTAPEQKRRPQEAIAFEEHVLWLFTILGFTALRLGVHERLTAPNSAFQCGSVDLLATTQEADTLLVIGCTINPPNTQDFTNLQAATHILRNETLPQPTIRILPLLITAAPGNDSFPATLHGVGVIDGSVLGRLVELASTRREGEATSLLLTIASIRPQTSTEEF